MTFFSTEQSETLAQIIAARRDVRGNRFSKKAIEQASLEKILDAALLAPSVGFSQPWQFVVVTKEETKAKIKRNFERENNRAKAQFNDAKLDSYQALKLEGIVEAPVNIAVFYNPSTTPVLGQNSMPSTGEYSVVCAIQNMWLMARALNIGLGWVSIIDPEHTKQVLQAPENTKLVAYLCLGHVDYFYSEPELEQRRWAARRKKSEVVFTDHF